MLLVRVPLVVLEGFSSGTRVTFIIFIQKPGFTAFLYFIYPALFLKIKFCERLQLLLFRDNAIFMHKAVLNYASPTKLDGNLPANPVNDPRKTNAVTLKSTFCLP